MYVHIFGYLVNKIEIWWVYLSPIEKNYNDVSDSICNCTDNHSHKLTESDLGDAIRKLKSDKGDGYDGLTSDYLINDTQLLFYYLSTLFSLMLSHCSTPKSFCISTMAPLPKNGSGFMGDIRNYRGIALSSLFSGIFDNCVINNQYGNLYFSHLQFAYKS